MQARGSVCRWRIMQLVFAPHTIQTDSNDTLDITLLYLKLLDQRNQTWDQAGSLQVKGSVRPSANSNAHNPRALANVCILLKKMELYTSKRQRVQSSLGMMSACETWSGYLSDWDECGVYFRLQLNSAQTVQVTCRNIVAYRPEWNTARLSHAQETEPGGIEKLLQRRMVQRIWK
jgi:hypothetical protein